MTGRAERRNDTVTQSPDSRKQSRKAALIVAIAGCFFFFGGGGGGAGRERDDCLLSQLATGSSRTPASRHLSPSLSPAIASSEPARLFSPAFFFQLNSSGMTISGWKFPDKERRELAATR